MRRAWCVWLLVPLLSAQSHEPQPAERVTEQVTEQPAEPAATRATPQDQKLLERDRKLQQVVDALVPLVEKYCELKFPKPPRVRAATHKEWRELIEREARPHNTGQLVATSMMMLGLYVPDVGSPGTGEVVISPTVMAPLLKELPEDAPRHHRRAQAQQKATLVHELTHALQDVHFALPCRMKRLLAAGDDDWRRCKYVLEGHAVFVEERVAEHELGIEDFMVTGPYVGNGDPSYANGWRFCRRVFAQGGMKALKHALAEPPPLDEILAAGAEQAAEEEAADGKGGADGAGKQPATGGG